jgi:anti-sigma factor RsiW
MPTEQMMSLLPWKRKKMGTDLSAYIDGELDAYRAAELSEDLVFDPRLQNKILQAVEPALAPPLAAPQTRKRLKPALVASVGLLVTAGITFAGLRRRGLV